MNRLTLISGRGQMLRYTKVVPVKVETVRQVLSETFRRGALAREIGVDFDELEPILQITLPFLGEFNGNWATVITRHYGLSDEEPLSTKELMELLGVSRSRVRQIHREAIWFLRRNQPAKPRTAHVVDEPPLRATSFNQEEIAAAFDAFCPKV